MVVDHSSENSQRNCLVIHQCFARDGGFIQVEESWSGTGAS